MTPIVVTSLREQVYAHLKERMNRGDIRPGAFLDLNSMSAEIGISRTPLRDALLQLEAEGFVTILPRRGVCVAPLTLDHIRNYYEIIGALEAATVMHHGGRLGPAKIDHMVGLNRRMKAALERDDFDLFYRHNLAFHNTYLDLSPNADLRGTVDRLKERLYDFPRREGFVKEWEVRSTGEHAAFTEFLARGDLRGAAQHLKEVHWSFSVQEPFIRRYYFASRQVAEGGMEGVTP